MDGRCLACFRVRRGASSFDIDAFFSHRSVFVISWTVLVCGFFFGSLASRFFLLSVAKHAKLAPLSGWWLASLLDHCLRVASRSFPHSLLRYFCCFDRPGEMRQALQPAVEIFQTFVVPKSHIKYRQLHRSHLAVSHLVHVLTHSPFEE